MEIVLGIGEEARPKASSSEIGSAKQQDEDLGEKTLEENGVRVSENGEQSDVDHNKSKEDVVETENLNDSGVIEDCVMNGVSSLLKLKQDVSDKEKEVDDEAKAEDSEEEEEEEHGYQVGDFVWGKIKNHPWWPGQIYDPSEASYLALKIKQKGKLLVAYFGDGTFAWCGPSQLEPFAESFKEYSNVSNSRGFLTAVEEAVEEIGRHMEFLLVHDCAEEKKHEIDNPKVKNAGIKEGVVVRDVRREMISSLLVGKPEGILQDVKAFAETVSFSGLLELEILKRKVSAFYRSKRGYGLTEYHEPESVPGLEDKNNDDDSEEDENVDDGIKWMRSGAKRSIKEKEEVVGPEESLPRSLEMCSGFPDHRLQHRRKQKSIAEILDNDAVAKVRFETEPEDQNGKSSRKRIKRRDEVRSELAAVTTTTPRGRRMKEVATIEEDGGREQVEENNKGKTFSRKRKKRDVDDGDNDGSEDREETEEVPVDETDNDSTPLASVHKRVKVDASSAANGEASTQTTKRERKKSKYFSPEYLSDFSSKGRRKNKIESESSKVPSQSQVEEQMTNATDSIVAMEEDKCTVNDSLVAVEEDKLERPCKSLLLENGVGHQEEVSEEVSNAVDFLRLGATAEVIRDLIRVSALGTQYPKDSSSRDMVREFMSIYRSFTYRDGANSMFLGSYNHGDTDKEEVNETTGSKEKARKDKHKAKQQIEEIEQVGKEENETDKHETAKKERKPKTPKSKKQVDEEEESRKESSEATKKERKRKKQADEEEEETLKELSETTKKERKRKKPESKKQADEKEETLKEANESIKKERKRKSESKKEVEEEEETLKDAKEAKESTKREREAKKPIYEEEETRNETEKSEKKKKREGKSKELKVDKRKIETEKEFSGAELLVTFGPGSSLPKKEELIEIYEKFGALDEEKTEMFYTNFCACVAFLNIADGEKAFESSQEKCPFTSTSTVKFRLKYTNERAEEKKAEAEVAETTTMEIEHLKKKLEEMISLVDGSAGGMTEEGKVKLEDEMVNLLEKVRKMPSS